MCFASKCIINSDVLHQDGYRLLPILWWGENTGKSLRERCSYGQISSQHEECSQRTDALQTGGVILVVLRYFCLPCAKDEKNNSSDVWPFRLPLSWITLCNSPLMLNYMRGMLINFT